MWKKQKHKCCRETFSGYRFVVMIEMKKKGIPTFSLALTLRLRSIASFVQQVSQQEDLNSVSVQFGLTSQKKRLFFLQLFNLKQPQRSSCFSDTFLVCGSSQALKYSLRN